jgi:hypothetical protein
MSATPDTYRRYIKDLQDGVFEDIGKNVRQSTVQATRQRQYQPVPKVPPLPGLDPRIDGKFLQGVAKIAQKVGANPEDLLKTMLYETGGTLSPSARNRRTKATGLIQFMPTTARGLGTNINALAQMSPHEQLPFVEKYLKQNSRGQKLDSFRKVLATVFGGNPNVPLGAGDGDITLGSYLRKAEGRYGNTARKLSQIAMQGGSINPNQMQQTVAQGTQIRLNTAQTKYQTELLNSGLSQENIDGKLLDFQRNFDSRIRTIQRGVRDAENSRLQDTRGIEDMRLGNTPVKSPEQQFLADQRNRTNQYDDRIRSLQQKLQDLQGNLAKSETLVQKAIDDSALKTADPKRYQVAVDTAKLAVNSVKQDIKTYSDNLATLEKQKSEVLKLNTEHFDKTEYFRLAELSIQSETEKIGVLQKQVEQYKLLEQVDPLNALVLKIPSLERNIALMTAEKDLRQQIISIDREYYNKQLTPTQFQEKITNAIKNNELQKENIELTKTQAQVTADLNRRTLELDKTQFLQQSKLKTLQLENQGLTLANRNGIVDLTTITNELTIKTDELTSAYERQRLELAKRNDLSPQEKLIEGLRQTKNFNRDLELAKQETDFRLKETELVTNPQAILNNANRRDELLGNPGLELRQLQIDSFRNRGGNEFVANKMARDLAMEQEKGRYETQLAQLQIDVAKFNLENPDIAITTEELNKLTESVHALHNANIQKIGMDFKTFGMSLNSMVNDAVKSLGSGLVELIKGTKSLEDVLDGFFDQILTGFLNMGIQSLLGGVFGGGGLFGGLFGFAKGGVVPNYALGGIHQAMQKEAMQSGRKPMLAVVHAGEMLIPADRVEQLERAGITTNALLGNYAKGGVVGGMPRNGASKVSDQGRNTEQTITVESTVINNVEYITVDQFREGMIQAAKKGANDGAAKVQNKMANSPSWRRSVGI